MRSYPERVSRDASSSWAFFARESERFDVVDHFHEEIEITLVRGGAGMRQIAGTVQPFHDGDLVLVGSNVPHAYWMGEEREADPRPVVWYTMQFRRDFLGDLFRRAPEFMDIGRLLTDCDGGWHFPSPPERILATLEDMAQCSPAVRTCRLIEILAELAGCERVPVRTTPQTVGPHPHSSTRLRTVLEHIRHHHGDELDLRDVARVAHLSPGGFSRFFSQAMGQSFTTYVASVRLDAASQDLILTDDPVAVIAARAGFTNLSNFNRRFRAVHHMTPREFRRARAS